MKLQKGHIKDTQEVFPARSFDVQEFFEDQGILDYIHKRTEKVVSVLHILSNLLDDRDAIKWQIRSISVDLLSRSNKLSFTSEHEREVSVSAFYKDLSLIKSSLEVLQMARMISMMNFNVIVREIDSINTTLPRVLTYKSVGEDFFKTEERLPQERLRITRDNLKESRYSKIHLIGQETVRVKDRSLLKGQSGKNPILKNDRRNAVLQTVMKKGQVTIKDISLVVKDCSEKTLQRELLRMVAENVLVKEGERRWSRYSLK